MAKKNTGRMTNAQRDLKKSQARDLFIKGFSLQTISEITEVGIKTLGSWRDADNWEHEKELNTIRPTEIKKMILEYVVAVKNGKAPPYKADDLSKISAAFDRLSDKRKKAVYSMETVDDFCSWLLDRAAKRNGKKREEALNQLKEIRVHFDAYITQLLQHE